MKILVVSNMFPDEKNPSYGVFVKNFCDQLESINVEYDKVVMRKKQSKISKVFNYLWFYIVSFMKCIFNTYDVIYIHYASHSSLGVFLASNIKKQNIYVNLHGSDVIPENYIQEKMQNITKIIINKSKVVIVPSEYFMRIVADKYKISTSIIRIYPSGGVNKDIFHRCDEENILKIRKEYDIKPNLYTFGMAGRISDKKGWDTFIDAIKLVIDNGYDGNFIIVGDGPESIDLEYKLKKLNLEDKINFKKSLISQKALSEYFSVLDWFVFPTRREGESLGLVAIESMACQTPVIASDFASPRYYIENGYNGFKFTVNDPKSLAECIIYIIDNKLTKADFKAALENTVEPFKSENTKSCLEKILAGDEKDEVYS